MIKLVKSSFYHEAETKQALADFILKEDILSMGPQCRMFEEAFAAKQGRRHAVYVGNGSVADFLLIQVMLNQGRLKKGDKVGFSALTWPTNVMPLIQLGLVPVAIDCNPKTLNVSAEELQKHVGEIKGLFLTNALGFCDDIEAIAQICADNDIVFMEDNCESLGSKVGDKLLGNFGIASTFSFFVGHHMSTIEGGMICTDDDDLHAGLVMSRAHGWDRNLTPDQQQKLRQEYGVSDFYAKYSFYDLASNFRPTEINGFLGNTQVEYWDEIVTRRADNFKRFAEAASGNKDIIPIEVGHMSLVSNFAMPVICKTPELAEQYRQKCIEADVEIRPIIAGDVSQQPFYKKYVRDITPSPNAAYVHDNGFYFGNNPEMTDEELTILCNILKGQ